MMRIFCLFYNVNSMAVVRKFLTAMTDEPLKEEGEQ
jgi:hypothetical protein